MIRTAPAALLLAALVLSCTGSHTGTYIAEKNGKLIDGIYVVEKIEIGPEKADIHLSVDRNKIDIVTRGDDPDLADCLRIASKNKVRSYHYTLEGNRLLLKKKTGGTIQYFDISGTLLTAPGESLYGGKFRKRM